MAKATHGNIETLESLLREQQYCHTDGNLTFSSKSEASFLGGTWDNALVANSLRRWGEGGRRGGGEGVKKHTSRSGK